jgi:hypothetical protein
MNQKSKIKLGSNRSFGLVFFTFFLIISLWPFTFDLHIKVLPLIISLFFLILGLMNSKLLTPLNKIWFKFGIFLGSIVSPIIMGIVFFLVVTPTGLIMKMFGKKMLDNAFDKNKKSYWINCNKKDSSMKNQF